MNTTITRLESGNYHYHVDGVRYTLERRRGESRRLRARPWVVWRGPRPLGRVATLRDAKLAAEQHAAKPRGATP